MIINFLKNLTLFVFTLVSLILISEFLLSYHKISRLELVSNTVLDLHPVHKRKSEGLSPLFHSNVSFEDKNEVKIAGRAFKKRKPKGKQRMLFLGDSATEGQGVLKSQRFTSLLEDKLANKWELINAAVPSFDNVDQLHVFNKLSFLKPDVVVWQLFMANDLQFNINHAEIDRRTFDRKYDLIKGSAIFKLCYLFLKTQRIDLLVDPIMDIKRKVKYIEGPSLWHPSGLSIVSYDEGEILLYLKKGSALEPIIYETFETILNEFQSIVEYLNARLLVVIVPTRTNILQKLEIFPGLEDATAYARSLGFNNEEDFDFSKPIRKVEAILSKNNVHYFNPLHDAGLEKQRFLLERDDHPSPYGHKVYADFIFSFLKKNKLGLHVKMK